MLSLANEEAGRSERSASKRRRGLTPPVCYPTVHIRLIFVTFTVMLLRERSGMAARIFGASFSTSARCLSPQTALERRARKAR